MDTRIKTFQLSLAIHVLIFTVFMWHGNSVLPPERLIVVDLGDAGREVTTETTEGIREKKKESIEMPQRNLPLIEQQQSPAVDQTLGAKPLLSVPVEESLINPSEALAGETSPIDDQRAQYATTPVNAENPPLPKGDSGGFGITGANNAPGSGKGDSVETAKSLYLKEHFAYIRDAIMKNLSYPAAARRMGWEGKVVVSFVVNEDGHVSDIKVIEGSGFGVLDRNAVETIKKASPFPKPPVKAELVMPIVYDLR